MQIWHCGEKQNIKKNKKKRKNKKPIHNAVNRLNRNDRLYQTNGKQLEKKRRKLVKSRKHEWVRCRSSRTNPSSDQRDTAI